MSHRVQIDLVSRSRKRKSLLAGGAVLGLGAVATLAAWSDDVWVASSFTTSPFNVEARVDPGEEWQEFNTSPGGELQFEVATGGMLAGQSTYAPLELRIGTGESDATVSLASAPSGDGLSGNNATFFNTLTLSLYAVEPDSCSTDGTATASPIDGFGGPENGGVALSTPGTGLVQLPGNGDSVGICFKVTLPVNAGPGVAGGTTGQLIWRLDAEPL